MMQLFPFPFMKMTVMTLSDWEGALQFLVPIRSPDTDCQECRKTDGISSTLENLSDGFQKRYCSYGW
jgi:hypothetical protein